MRCNAVEPLLMQPDATLRDAPVAAVRGLGPEHAPSVRIRFQKPGEATERVLYYFSADLSDQGLAKNRVPLQWFDGFAPRATYIKSASYLMHKTYFSAIREFILAKSAVIVQDDSGVPLRFVAESNRFLPATRISIVRRNSGRLPRA